MGLDTMILRGSQQAGGNTEGNSLRGRLTQAMPDDSLSWYFINKLYNIQTECIIFKDCTTFLEGDCIRKAIHAIICVDFECRRKSMCLITYKSYHYAVKYNGEFHLLTEI